MRILFINQYYCPDSAATAQMLTDLAERLVLKGHQVTVVCSRKPYSGNGAAYPRKERHNGVEIVRLPATGGGRRAGLVLRAMDSLSFYMSAVVKCLALPKADVVITLTSPPMIGLLGWLVSRSKRSRHIHWCMDMFSDLSVANGLINAKGVVNKVLEFLTRVYIRSCHGVIVLGPHMAERMKRYSVDPGRLHIVPVWANGAQIRPIRPEENRFIEKHNLQNKFIILYSGNIGIGETFDAVVKAAERLAADDGVVFVFISNGRYFDQLRARVLEKGLSSFLFLPYQDRSDLAYNLSAGHLHLVYFTPGKEGMKVPSKIYGIMAAGGPVLYIGNPGNEIADIVSQNNIGFCVQDGDPEGLVEIIRRAHANPQLLTDMSARSRAGFTNNYDVEIVTERINRLLEKVCKGEKRCMTAPQQ